MRKRIWAPLLVFLFAAAIVFSQKKLSASEAKGHIGEEATVCGKVVSTRYSSSSGGQPTFLNLDKAYPEQLFTIVIWGRNRPNFGKPDVDYKDKRVCVTGKIDEYRGVPQIEAREPKQIQIEK